MIEWQLRLMKLAGIDGILLDWYGEQGSNGDLLPQLKRNSDTILHSVEGSGLQLLLGLASVSTIVRRTLPNFHQNHQ